MSFVVHRQFMFGRIISTCI